MYCQIAFKKITSTYQVQPAVIWRSFVFMFTIWFRIIWGCFDPLSVITEHSLVSRRPLQFDSHVHFADSFPIPHGSCSKLSVHFRNLPPTPASITLNGLTQLTSFSAVSRLPCISELLSNSSWPCSSSLFLEGFPSFARGALLFF